MSRELYDLCRKYKYFYKKHEDVKSWDRKYHDIDLSDAVRKTELDLNRVRDDLQNVLFKEHNVICTSIKINPEGIDMGYRCGVPTMKYPIFPRTTAIVEFENSNEFLRLLADTMRFP